MSQGEGILLAVQEAFRTLPKRYLGSPPGTDSTVQIRLPDVGRVWEVRLRADRCVVRSGTTHEPDVTIVTEAATWLRLRDGHLSGLDAYAQRLLSARGDLDLALAFEGWFELPDGRRPLQRLRDVMVGRTRVSTLTVGDGPRTAILLHGLGSTKASMFETIPSLAVDHTVHAIDLPGFGSSAKPARAGYNAPYFAKVVVGLMDALEVDRARLVGNSMGGRVALEVGLEHPDRVEALGLLAPAVAFLRNREWVPVVRVLRPELALLPHTLRRQTIRNSLLNMFADPSRIDPDVADVVADEFLRIYGSAAARLAFYAAARNIYLEPSHGKSGFWTRLEDLEPPALFIWGSRDRLVPAAFARRVAEILPRARNVVLKNCGHVPQVELPDRTNALLREFFDSTERRPARRARAIGA